MSSWELKRLQASNPEFQAAKRTQQVEYTLKQLKIGKEEQFKEKKKAIRKLFKSWRTQIKAANKKSGIKPKRAKMSVDASAKQVKFCLKIHSI